MFDQVKAFIALQKRFMMRQISELNRAAGDDCERRDNSRRIAVLKLRISEFENAEIALNDAAEIGLAEWHEELLAARERIKAREAQAMGAAGVSEFADCNSDGH